MQTVTIKDQDYAGPTKSCHGETIERLTQKFRNVQGPEQLRKALKTWGLSDLSPRQARFWDEAAFKEKQIFVEIAQVSPFYINEEWRAIPQPIREKLWSAIGRVASWAEKLKGRF